MKLLSAIVTLFLVASEFESACAAVDSNPIPNGLKPVGNRKLKGGVRSDPKTAYQKHNDLVKNFKFKDSSLSRAVQKKKAMDDESKEESEVGLPGFWIHEKDVALQKPPFWFYKNELGAEEFENQIQEGNNVFDINVMARPCTDYSNVVEIATNTKDFTHNWRERNWRGNPSAKVIAANGGDKEAAIAAELKRTTTGLGYMKSLFKHIATSPVVTEDFKRGINDVPSVLFREDGEFSGVLSPSAYMAQLHLLVWSLHPEDTISIELNSVEQHNRLVKMRDAALVWLKANNLGDQPVTFGLHTEPSVYRIHLHVLVGNLTFVAIGDKNSHNAERWTPLDLVLDSF